MTSILITGGTGFFAKHFTKHLLSLSEYERICIYSRDEHKQASMLHEFGSDPRLRFFIGDVRDKTRLRRAMAGCDVIVHAAALKRIETGFYNPDEMLKTNVHGTMNVIDAATDVHAEKVVYLSTDKAYQPVSPYGMSKAMAEALILSANTTHASPTKFAVTRYGNVAGSTGSVIPKWRELITSHYFYKIKDFLADPQVPVTDPECTRFWMTADQAVQLVMQAIEEMPTSPLIPELPAFRLKDLASAMNASMLVTGLPAGEKKHESMCFGNSSDTARRMSVEELKEALKHV
jgi:UDP-N-acetylglucosamine 4,6-dehydratase